MVELQAFSESLLRPLQPDSLFISGYEGRLTYAAFASRVRAAASILCSSFDTRQTLVFVVCDNCVAFVVALFALNYLAQVVIPLFARYGPAELRALYDLYKPSIVIADKRFHSMFLSRKARILSFEDLALTRSAVPPTVNRNRDDVCFILLTSGARGPAKGVVLTNGNVLSNIIGIQDYMRVSETDRCLITRSLTHASGMVGELLLTELTGGTCVLRRTPNTISQLFEWSAAEAITWMGISPVLLKMIVDYGRTHRREIHLKRIVVSGAILSRELCRSFLETFPRTELINAYGLTEASPRVSYLPASLASVKPGSVGYPIKGCRIRVMNKNRKECASGDVGEIEVSGPNVMRGYFPYGMRGIRPKKAAWLKTGDSGYRDTNGALFILGRLDTMFVHNGLNIYPEYVSMVLEKCPAVRKAEIAHVAHGRQGARLLAFVELHRELSQQGALSQIHDYLMEHLDTRKHPDEIVIVRGFSLTPSGKIDVRQLLEEHWLPR